jgi:hypothetical protein
VDAEFVCRMEDLLDLYEAPHDEHFPVVCFDETPAQLVEETSPSLPVRPGQPLKYDYEYKRLGVCHLFMSVCPKGGYRHTWRSQPGKQVRILLIA